jgi:hypothetical protein
MPLAPVQPSGKDAARRSAAKRSEAKGHTFVHQVLHELQCAGTATMMPSDRLPPGVGRTHLSPAC